MSMYFESSEGSIVSCNPSFKCGKANTVRRTGMFEGLSMSHLIILLVIVLVIFGAGKLPEVGSALGKGIKNFKSSMSENPAADKPVQGDIEDKHKREQGG
jgi:sec-independent protein translocase protein TatA